MFWYQFLDGKFNVVRNTLHHSQKGENGQALAGAVFAVTADITGEQVGTITTDENGVGTITGLIKQLHTVQEIFSSNRLCSLRRTYQDQQGRFWGMTCTFLVML